MRAALPNELFPLMGTASNWFLEFLTVTWQVIQTGNTTCSKWIINTGALEGFCSRPQLLNLNRSATHIKLTDGSTVIWLISSDEMAHEEEVANLTKRFCIKTKPRIHTGNGQVPMVGQSSGSKGIVHPKWEFCRHLFTLMSLLHDFLVTLYSVLNL